MQSMIMDIYIIPESVIVMSINAFPSKTMKICKRNNSLQFNKANCEGNCSNDVNYVQFDVFSRCTESYAIRCIARFSEGSVIIPHQ